MAKKKPLTRDAFLALKPVLKRREVYIEEWGHSVLLRELTAGEQEEIRKFTTGRDDFSVEDTLRLLTLSVIDSDGNRLLEEDDAKHLMNHSGRIVAQLIREATELNQVDVEIVRKNS